MLIAPILEDISDDVFSCLGTTFDAIMAGVIYSQSLDATIHLFPDIRPTIVKLSKCRIDDIEFAKIGPDQTESMDAAVITPAGNESLMPKLGEDIECQKSSRGTTPLQIWSPTLRGILTAIVEKSVVD